MSMVAVGGGLPSWIVFDDACERFVFNCIAMRMIAQMSAH